MFYFGYTIEEPYSSLSALDINSNGCWFDQGGAKKLDLED